MICAGCGKPIEGVACCENIGYWYDQPPLAMDSMKVGKRGKWYLYLSCKWPKGRKAVLPS